MFPIIGTCFISSSISIDTVYLGQHAKKELAKCNSVDANFDVHLDVNVDVNLNVHFDVDMEWM